MRMGALNKQSIATAVGFDMEFYDEVLWRLYAGDHPELTGDCIYVRPRNVSILYMQRRGARFRARHPQGDVVTQLA